MLGKSLFASKTFWLNILGSTIVVAGSGVVPTKYSVPVLGIANLVMRLLTDQPITSFFPSSTNNK